MINRTIRSPQTLGKILNLTKLNANNLDFLSNKSIYSNKSLLYSHQILNNANNSKFLLNSVLIEKNFKYKLKSYNYFIQHVNSSDHASSFTKLGSIELARQFVNSLTIDERNIIKEQIIEAEKQTVLNVQNNQVVVKPSWKQLSVVCLQCGLPFIGFGFVDNFLMIIAGDFIEEWIGAIMPISTMAAAGLGNAVSDVAGIGIAHHIEAFALKLVKEPQLTSEQWNLPIVSWLSAISKSICIFIGCVIGMAPLLFKEDKEKSSENEKKPTKDSLDTTK